MILANVGLSIFNNWAGSRQNKQIADKREEFERAARDGQRDRMLRLMREGQELTLQMEEEKHQERLQELKITISMTEDGNPTDNAIAERVNGIIKQEWLYRMKRPANIKQARTLIKQIIEFYNTRRPHMSNGMKTPAQMRAVSVA